MSCQSGSKCVLPIRFKRRFGSLVERISIPSRYLRRTQKHLDPERYYPLLRPENSLAVLVESLHVDNGVPAVRTRLAICQSCVQVDADVAFQRNCVAIVGQIQIQWDNIPNCSAPEARSWRYEGKDGGDSFDIPGWGRPWAVLHKNIHLLQKYWTNIRWIIPWQSASSCTCRLSSTLTPAVSSDHIDDM